MDVLIAFLKDYKEYILLAFSLILVLLDFLILFIKRRPKTYDDFKQCLSDVLSVLPSLILSVEEPGNGSAKKEKVLKSALEIFKNRLGRCLSDSENSIVEKVVSRQVEIILSTPQSKGGSNES